MPKKPCIRQNRKAAYSFKTHNNLMRARIFQMKKVAGQQPVSQLPDDTNIYTYVETRPNGPSTSIFVIPPICTGILGMYRVLARFALIVHPLKAL